MATFKDFNNKSVKVGDCVRYNRVTLKGGTGIKAHMVHTRVPEDVYGYVVAIGNGMVTVTNLSNHEKETWGMKNVEFWG